jgi:hypothetical protein
MKAQLKILLAAFGVLLSVGCAQDSGGGGNSGSPGTGTTTGLTCPAGQVLVANNTCVSQSGGLTGSNTVALNVVSVGELDRLFYSSNPQSPQNIQVQINVASAQNSIVISYVDITGQHQASFGTVHPLNPSVTDSTYNMWYQDQMTNKQVWKGFFQDLYGAVVLVIDQTVTIGDGAAGGLLGGSIWFQNFGPAGAPQGPLKMCWQITAGPFDCRSFLWGYDSSNMLIEPTLSTYPNNKGPDAVMAYEKLGTFTGLNRSAAGL